MTPRILWVDDDKGAFDAFSDNWPTDTSYELVFAEIDELARDDGEALQRHVDDPPAVLLMDWQEGLYEPVYVALRDRVARSILVSLVPQETLAQTGVYERHPKLSACTLQSPFTANQLKALLPRVAPPAEQPPRPTPHNATESEETQSPTFSLSGTLAIRFLDANLQPVSKTAAWRTNLNRPSPDLRQEAQSALKTQGFCHQVDFGVDPVTEQFGSIQLSTHRLSIASPDGSPPPTARYVQWVTPILEQAEEGLATYSTSAGGILDLMKTAGFDRGRFYRLSEVSGLERPLLELVARVPEEPNLRPLPAAAVLDDSERQQLEEHLAKWEADKKELIYVIRKGMANYQDSANDTAVWNGCVASADIDERLEIPVLAWDLTSKTPSARKLTDVVKGLFIFDLGRKGEIGEKRINRRLVLQALNYFQSVRQTEEARFKRYRAERLLQLHSEFAIDEKATDLEARLVVAAREILALTTQDDLGEPPNRTPTRCVMFARYDERTQELKITKCTEEWMTGFIFGLELDRFAHVRAANKALEALERHSEARQPVFEPSLRDMTYAHPTLGLATDDWQSVEGCHGDLVVKCQSWYQKIQAVVACPITSDDLLMGVLVIWSTAAFEFTRRRVDTVLMIADAAKPYLSRLRTEERRIVWTGFVMHEMRRHLSRANNKIDLAINHPIMEKRDLALRETALVLKSGHDQTQLFMNGLGWTEPKDDAYADASFWNEIDAFGQLCARSHPGFDWRFGVESTVRALHSSWLGRVLRVLIDNAFTYADKRFGVRIDCTAVQSKDSEWVDMRVSNPGRIDAVALNSTHRLSRSHVGTTLAVRACQDAGATLHFANETRPEDPTMIAVARLRWPTPKASNVKGESDESPAH